MAALTTGGEVPACHHRRGCHGCSGCYGCNGCYGSGCNGCYGGCHGCYGGGWGPYAGVGDYGYGCWGYGCNGCSGYYACYGGWTCYGNFGCTCAPHDFSTVPVAPEGPVMPDRPSNNNGEETEKNPEKKGDMPEDKNNKKKKGDAGSGDDQLQLMSLNPDRARLIVTLPADAKLYVDGQPMRTPSERRVFHTPQLAPGQYYYYNLRAELVRDGRTITRERRVVVRGGSVTRASFTDMPDDGPTITVQR
jgi:uncharacterized protein (TIGR03000 family)